MEENLDFSLTPRKALCLARVVQADGSNRRESTQVWQTGETLLRELDGS
jgi:hypothetical protein